jgi:hypothetical protein
VYEYIMMSTMFRNIFIPPEYSNWREWIVDVDTNVDTNVDAYLNIETYNELPKDVWNIIMQYVFKIDEINSKKWKDNPIYWMEEWVENKMMQQHIHIPLYNEKESNFNAGLFHLDKHQTCDCVISLKSNDVNNNKPIPRLGDVIFGFQIDDISNIKKLALEVGGNLLASFVFSTDYERTSISMDGEKVLWYFHPEMKVIPLISLPYHEVRLILIRNDNTQDIPYIGVLYGLLQTKYRYVCVERIHSLNKKDKTILVYNGMCHGYFAF